MGTGAALAAFPFGTVSTDPFTERTGFNLVAWGHSPWSAAQLRAALSSAAALGIDRITLVTFRYVDPASGRISHRSGTELPDAPSDRLVAETLAFARKLGLETSLNPLVEMAHPRGIGYLWRGDMEIERSVSTTFFQGYGNYLLDMAELVRDHGVARLFVGAELVRLSTEPELRGAWLDVIAKVRDALSAVKVGRQAAGRRSPVLGYSANFSEYPEVTFWNALDEIAVSAYFPLADPDEARGPDAPSTALLRERWARHLDALRAFGASLSKPVSVSEWGLVPFDLSSTVPWDVAPSEVPDTAEQRRGYEAVLDFLRTDGRWLSGLDFWHWYVGPESGPFAIRAGTPLAELLASRALER